jgi:hypothetical protein
MTDHKPPAEKPLPSPDQARTKSAREVVQQYVDDLKAIIEKLRWKLH